MTRWWGAAPPVLGIFCAAVHCVLLAVDPTVWTLFMVVLAVACATCAVRLRHSHIRYWLIFAAGNAVMLGVHTVAHGGTHHDTAHHGTANHGAVAGPAHVDVLLHIANVANTLALLSAVAGSLLAVRAARRPHAPALVGPN